MDIGPEINIVLFNLTTTLFYLDIGFEAWLFSNLLRFEIWLKQNFGAEQENPGERISFILFSEELWTSVNVLAHKHINKLCRVISRLIWNRVS